MTTIYNLVAPDGEIRYVGKTTWSPRIRLRAHINSSKRWVHTHKAHWIRHLLNSGHVPELRVIGAVPDDNSSLAEQICIFAARHLGARLTNTTDGGEGGTGIFPSPETRRLLSEHAKTRRHSAETRARISESNMGRVVSDETRRKSAATRLRKRDAREAAGVFSGARMKELFPPPPAKKRPPPSEETRAKMSAAWKLRAPASAETRAKISAAMRERLAKYGGRLPISAEAIKRGVETRKRNNKPMSEETRRKIGAAHKGKTLSDETRKRISDARRALYENKRLTGLAV